MANQSKTHTTDNKQSALDKFSIGYEYNIPWNQAVQTSKLRPTKKS
ncbi:MAG: hypothetical protein WAW80_02000 [Candidatus Saccharimonadales bacterium]